MSNDDVERYTRRMRRVLDYLHEHFEEPLSLDRLSEVASFSRFHFHRQFSAFTGITVHRLVRLLRLKQAARRLAFVADRRVTDIALDAGFESPEAFSRAFRRQFGQSPSAFRAAPDWQRWREAVKLVPQHSESSNMNVEIVEFPHKKVALLAHRGPEPDVYETVRRFVEWRRETGVPPHRGETYGLHYDDACDVAPEDYRFDICVTYDEPLAPNRHGVVSGEIPAGRCAKVRHHGSREHIPAAHWLYADWLPASGEELRDCPFFFHYVNVGDVKDADMVTDLYLPIR